MLVLFHIFNKLEDLTKNPNSCQEKFEDLNNKLFHDFTYNQKFVIKLQQRRYYHQNRLPSKHYWSKKSVIKDVNDLKDLNDANDFFANLSLAMFSTNIGGIMIALCIIEWILWRAIFVRY